MTSQMFLKALIQSIKNLKTMFSGRKFIIKLLLLLVYSFDQAIAHFITCFLLFRAPQAEYKALSKEVAELNEKEKELDSLIAKAGR